jgi:cytochrome c-type biogenesis protein CcmH
MAYFWLVAGFMAGIAAAFFVVQLWHRDVDVQQATLSRSRWVAAIAIGVFLLVAVAIYFRIGRPELADQDIVATAVDSHASTANAAGNATGSMAKVAAKLASKLTATGGSDADWQLLQQSYAFLGDTEAADLAQQHRLNAPAGAADAAKPTATTATTVTDQAALVAYQQAVANKPADSASWLAIAQLQRSARNFADANAAFEQVIKLKAMNADAWADYADVSASIAGTLTNASTRTALDAALQLEPTHSKALWLKASLAHEERRYAAALKLWQQLRAAIPDSSPDVSIIDANIKEAQSLAGAAHTTVATTQKASPVSAQVSGSVALDPAFKNRVTDGMTLFVYAKAADSAVPVAAYRTSVKSWPVKFLLDDTQAMLPTRKLSQFDTVMVSARLSRSGQALAQAGDLQTDVISVATHSGKSAALHISKQVP